MQTILLLGGFGFIGTNILKHIDIYQLDSYRFIVFDKFKTHLYDVKFDCLERVYYGDYSNINDIEPIFKENKIDIVLHSLSSTVPSTSDNILYDIESNLIPTIRLLDMMVKYRVQKIVYISSGGAVYGNENPDKKHSETDIEYPISSYGIVKLAIEKYLHYYSNLYNLKILIFRLSNPFGKYHYNTRQGIINVAARSAVFSRPFFIWGNGDTKKDYIFIEDFCDILFKLINPTENFQLLNVGSGQVFSANHIVQTIQEIIPDFNWSCKEKKETDVQMFELDTTKLLSIIGPYCFTPFLAGLKKTLQWLESTK
jgi:UDP-glucose 4-epimerase